jgi:hypothetical protein
MPAGATAGGATFAGYNGGWKGPNAERYQGTNEVVILGVLAALVVCGLGLLLWRSRRGTHRARTPHRWRRLGLLCAAAVAVGVLAAVPSVLAAAQRLKQARVAFHAAAASAGRLDLAGAGAGFAHAGALAAQARTSLDSPLTAVARWVPLVGGNINEARSLASGAVQMAQAGAKATAAGTLLAPTPARAPAPAPGAGAAAALGQIKIGSWQQANTLLAQASALANAAVNAVHPSPGLLVPALGAARLEFLRKGEQAQSGLSQARDGAALVPVIFGAGTTRTFFLAIENPDEMRATGGLIGAFGILQAQGGKLSLTRFDSDAALPKLPAPVPASPQFMARYDRFNSRSMWLNVNMSPDFPTTARLIAEMWQSATGTRIDGVISVDAQGLRDLLGAVGPVTASNGEVISPTNFLSVALNQAYLQFPKKAGRVDYLLEVGRQVWSRLAAGQFASVRGLAGSLEKAVKGKDLQVWIPGQQALLTRLGVTGALTPPKPGEDYLYVVGQNAGANKVDYYAQRSIDYTVFIGAHGSVSGRLGVQVENNTPTNLTSPYIVGPFLPGDPPGLNRSYVSVYLPRATGVLKATVGGTPVGIESETEGGLGVVSRFLEALPGRSSTLVLQTAGLKTRTGEYRLVVQHQPTLNPDRFRLEVVVPQGYSIDGPVPSGTTSGGRVLIWQGTLVSDMTFVVHYGASGGR